MTQVQPIENTTQSGKWKTYPAYKDSGVEWLGEIPKHWDVRRLKYITAINLDVLPENTNPEYIIKYVDISNVNSNGLIIDTQELFYKDAPSRARRLVRNGDTIISTVRTYLRAISYMDNPSENIVVSTGFAVLSPGSKVYPKFLWRVVQSYEFVSTVVAHSEGVSYPAINPNHLGDLPVWLPSLPEQRAITAFLDRETTKINALIAKKERMIELLREKRTALISHAVTKGLDPTVKMKDSGVEWIGGIPEHWEVKKLKYLAAILRGKFSHRPRNDPRMYDGPYPFIQTGDITATSKYITKYQQTLSELGFTVSKQFPSQTLVMAIAANIGDTAILQFSACFPDSIVGFIPVSNVDLEYLYYHLIAMKPELVSTATINTQLNLNIERIGSLFSVCPSLPEQEAIVVYLNQETARIDALITRIGEGIEKLKEYSTALISAAVTGKIDVREIVDDTGEFEHL